MFTLYARKEPTTCNATIEIHRIEGTPVPSNARDVVLYRDKDATTPCGRYPWHYAQSKPSRRNRWQNLNCYRYRLKWLPDAA